MASFRITPRGIFSLYASTRFLEGFSPAAYEPGTHRDHLHLAFAVEGDWAESVGACIRQTDKGVIGEIYGDADPRAVRRQVERILSLDVDGSNFLEVGERDRVVARLQRSIGDCARFCSGLPMRRQPGPSSGIASAFLRRLASSSAWRWSWETRSTCTVLVCSPSKTR